jgi:hypothetical protein
VIFLYLLFILNLQIVSLIVSYSSMLSFIFLVTINPVPSCPVLSCDTLYIIVNSGLSILPVPRPLISSMP